MPKLIFHNIRSHERTPYMTLCLDFNCFPAWIYCMVTINFVTLQLLFQAQLQVQLKNMPMLRLAGASIGKRKIEMDFGRRWWWCTFNFDSKVVLRAYVPILYSYCYRAMTPEGLQTYGFILANAALCVSGTCSQTVTSTMKLRR